MTEMLEALNQVLFCVVRGHRPAQMECLPLVTLLLPLIGNVDGCVDVIKEILVDNRQVAKQVSDEDIDTMVNMLRMSAPKSLLEKIERETDNLPGHESQLLRCSEINWLVENLEKKHQHIASLVTELIIFIILSCKVVATNQRRVLDAFMRETLPIAGVDKHRLQLEIDMKHVNGKEYQVAMEHTDWRTSPELSYHLSIMKIMSVCCMSKEAVDNVSEVGLGSWLVSSDFAVFVSMSDVRTCVRVCLPTKCLIVTVCHQVQCQSMVDFDRLMFFASQDYVSYQVIGMLCISSIELRIHPCPPP